MVARAVIASILLAGTLGPAALATQGDKAPRTQSAIVSFERPTWVAGEVLIGTYVIVHDEDRMSRGEACTALYRVGASTPVDAVVSFRCAPRERPFVSRFTTTTLSNPAGSIDAFDILAEYQFPGDAEGHGVPIGLAAHASASNCR